MIDETIKHVTHKLHQTILTSDTVPSIQQDTTSAGTSKSINTPSITDIWTPAITDNPRQDSTTAFQLPRNTSLHPTNTDPDKNATCIKVNCPPMEKTLHLHLHHLNKPNQIIMDIDILLHSNTLCNKILQSLNLNGLCKYDSLHKAYIFEQLKHSDQLFPHFDIPKNFSMLHNNPRYTSVV